MKILIVEDEKLIASALRQVLKKENYLVDISFDGQTGLDNALTGQYDVIILDLLLPIIDGITILKTIRNEKIDTPVLMLTAMGETRDKIIGLDSGADDYLAKPFEMEELIARIRALARRRPKINAGVQLSFGSCTLDAKQQVIHNNGQSVTLTIKESQILEVLIINSNSVVSKEQLIEKIWGYDTDAVYGNVETQVSLLRKKLRQIDSDITIKAIRGSGYILSPIK